jgi:hypothetical protein
MRHRAIAATCLLAGLLACSSAQAASAARSVGTPEQIAWVRRAAGNFIAAELRGDGAGACAILAAPLRAPQNGRSCQLRWQERLARLRGDRAARAALRADARAAASATVIVRGYSASIALPAPLLNRHSRFRWSEMCWMLER